MVTIHNMFTLKRSISCDRCVISALAGCSLLCASALPWLKEPLGGVYSAWQLPVYPGWLDRTNMLNYGLLCLVCAVYTFLVAWAGWKPFKGHKYFAHCYDIACCLCVVPVVLFLLQYLCIDVSAIALLAHHKIQVLLVQQHFGYQATTQLLPLNPLKLSTSTFIGRLQLLLNQLSFGPLFLCVCAMLIPGYSFFHVLSMHPAICLRWYNLVLSAVCVCGLVAILIRAPVGMLCEYAAKEVLSSGNYTWALKLLNAAHSFTPELEQVAYYHRERGEAQYFLSPDQPTVDSRVYLAATYREQGDYLDAYQQLLVVWRANPAVPWVVDEMGATLEDLTEAARPLRGVPLTRRANDDTALPWLQTLIKVDPSNIYGFYFAGRIQYDLHNYTTCIAYMSSVIHLSSEAAIQSSAYTYIALSEAGLGNYAESRLFLFKAVSLDPNYHNTTAREELSGLH